MKTLVKFMALIIIGSIVTISLVYLVNLNIMINEMNNASKVAIDSCQKIIQSITIDNCFDIEGYEYPIHDDESYKEYFINSFNRLVANKNIYDLDVFCDYSKGLLAVRIHNNYSSFIQDKKIVNIIEVSG